MNEMNKIITSEGNVQFQTPDGKIINVHPFHIYTVFNEDTVSFLLIAMPKSSGLAIFTSKAEDLEVDGTVYTIDELPNALSEAFAKAGAVARYEIVDELPTSGQSNTIYLVPKSEGIGYDEYIYVNGEWELIGDTDIELDRYVDKETFSGYTADTLVLINTVSGDVITESERAISAETALQEAIDNEVSARTADVEALSGAVDNVQDEVDILSAALEDEVSARTEADSALQGLIDTVSGDVITEASARTDADTALGNKIDGKVVELTQSEYDSLVDKDPLVMYIITDATEVDMNDYYTSAQTDTKIAEATSGKLDTSVFETYSGNVETALNSKLDATAYTPTDLSNYYTKDETSGKTEIATALNGKQKTIASGRGITITTGSTADTVSIKLSISGGTGNSAIIENNGNNVASGDCSHAEGSGTKAKGSFSHAEGRSSIANGYSSHAEGEVTLAKGNMSHAEGNHTEANGNASHAEGDYAKAYGASSHAEGSSTIAKNDYEHASGRFNNSAKMTTTFGNGGNTLFSVGNGTADNARHNAFEIRQNGDIYITSGGTDIKLQDALGQGGISSGEVQTMIDNSISGKVDTSDFETYSGAVDSRLAENEEVTAAALNELNDKIDAIDLSEIENRLSEDEEVTARALNELNDNIIDVDDKFDGLKLKKITQAEYDALVTKDANTLYIVID